MDERWCKVTMRPSPRRATGLSNSTSGPASSHDLVACARGFGPQGCHLGRAQDIFPIGTYNREYSWTMRTASSRGSESRGGAATVDDGANAVGDDQAGHVGELPPHLSETDVGEYISG
jgi:hypothetical protein